MDDDILESLLSQHPLLLQQREKLSTMKCGAFCRHKTFGFGEIISYDKTAGRLIVNFAQMPNHSIDPLFAIKHLEILPAEHLLVQFRQNPEEMLLLLKESPAEALRLILEHSKERRATAGEITDLLAPILGEKEAKAWTNRAKKEAETDPQISPPEKRSGYYVLREQPIEQIDELIDGVILSKQILKKIQCATKFLAEKKFEKCLDRMAIIFEEFERLHLSPSLGDAEKLQVFWMCQDFAAVLDIELPEKFSLIEVLQSLGDMTSVADSLSVAQLNRFLNDIMCAYPENFHAPCVSLIRNGSSRTIGTAADFLIANGGSDVFECTLKQLLHDNIIHATLLDWVIRNRHQRKYSAMLLPLIGPELFRIALSIVDQEALKRTSSRKIQLAETLIGDRQLEVEVVQGLSFETARDLAHIILVNQYFDLLTKRSLIARFIRVFPSLQSMLDLDSGSSTSSEETVLRVSQDSLDVVRREYEQLIRVKIPANTEAVERAREEGDLRENSEYKMARQDQDMLLARKAQIERELSLARVVDFAEATEKNVGIGSVVTLVDSAGNVERIALLGAWDSDPGKNIMAYKTPFGRGLLGKQVGDSIAVDGQCERVIQRIERWVDCAENWTGK
jgi:transcription elongation GreA/GreB family factor/transcription elongation factor GreA-like protein